MRVRIRILFDTVNWPDDSDFWYFAPGLTMVCDASEMMANVEAIYGLGHSAEITYLEDK